MHAPGVTVRPLRQIDGAIHFNEVFLDERARARRPASSATCDDGWRVAMTTLTAERTAIGGGGQTGWREIAELARRLGRHRRPGAAPGASPGSHTREMIQRWLVYRVRTAAAHGPAARARGVGAQAA